MRVRCLDNPDLASALGAVVERDEPGLVFVAGGSFAEWRETEDELAEAFLLTQQEVSQNGPAVYVVGVCELLGRAAPLDAAVAAGLLAGARAVAFERQRFAGYATVVAAGEGVGPLEIADAVGHLLATRASNGQPFVLGNEHLGAALP